MSHASSALRPPLFTIFTPTFNRAHTLPRVYESIAAQGFRDFEWVIVDDGSTDHSEDLVRGWIAEANFPIRYFKQANGHKKTAFNHGVREARGDFFLCWDSDDTAPRDALQKFRDAWFSIPEDVRDGYAGVTGLCVDEAGHIVGDQFPASPFDGDDLSMRFGTKIGGEKWGFHRRDVLLQYPYPEFIPGFVLEGLVWNAIARRYRTRYINEIVRIYHVEPDSLVNSTKTLEKIRSIADGSCYTYTDFIDHNWRWFFRSPVEIGKIAANQTRFSWHMRKSGKKSYRPSTLPGFMLKALAWPVGFSTFIYDKVTLSEQ